MFLYFILNFNIGQISVRVLFIVEIRDSYQGRIVVFDGGLLFRSVIVIVIINIQRNLNFFVFSLVNYE